VLKQNGISLFDFQMVESYTLLFAFLLFIPAIRACVFFGLKPMILAVSQIFARRSSPVGTPHTAQ
jgi:hypothetical protein